MINPRYWEFTIPKSFDNCYTYAMQIAWLRREIDNLSTGGEGSTLQTLSAKVTALETTTVNLQTEIDAIDTTEIEADIASIKREIDNIETAMLAKADKSELLNFMTEAMVNAKLVAYLTKTEADATYAPKSANGYVTPSDLTTQLATYATKAELSGYVTPADLQPYVREAELDAYDTSVEVDTKLSNYATKAELPNMADYVSNQALLNTLQSYATKTYVDNQVATRITNSELSQRLALYALKSEIPDVSNFITQSNLDNALSGYVETSDLSNYVQNSELSNYVETEDYTGSTIKSKLENDECIDSEPTEDSTNLITSGAVYDALQGQGGGSPTSGLATQSLGYCFIKVNNINDSSFDEFRMDIDCRMTVDDDNNLFDGEVIQAYGRDTITLTGTQSITDTTTFTLYNSTNGLGPANVIDGENRPYAITAIGGMLINPSNSNAAYKLVLDDDGALHPVGLTPSGSSPQPIEPDGSDIELIIAIDFIAVALAPASE